MQKKYTQSCIETIVRQSKGIKVATNSISMEDLGTIFLFKKYLKIETTAWVLAGETLPVVIQKHGIHVSGNSKSEAVF